MRMSHKPGHIIIRAIKMKGICLFSDISIAINYITQVLIFKYFSDLLCSSAEQWLFS